MVQPIDGVALRVFMTSGVLSQRVHILPHILKHTCRGFFNNSPGIVEDVGLLGCLPNRPPSSLEGFYLIWPSALCCFFRARAGPQQYRVNRNSGEDFGSLV